MINDQIKKIKVLDLELDINNPRFAELYNGDSSQDAIVNYLLKEEWALDIANNILKAKEFYVYEPLWVIKKGDKYLVKDGNRRLSAVIALADKKYGLDELFPILELPVFVFDDEQDLDRRIAERHSVSSFKEWSRIAKALMVYQIYEKEWEEGIYTFDSKPKDLLKLASFYYAAVDIWKDDFKSLLKKGKWENGWKTIIFERMFQLRKKCWYDFSRAWFIEITSAKIFHSYVLAMIQLLKENSEITHKIYDDEKDLFLDRLQEFWFNNFHPPQLFTTVPQNFSIEQKTLPNIAPIFSQKKTQTTSQNLGNNENKKTIELQKRRSSSTINEDKLFGKFLILKKWKINSICWWLDELYESIKDKDFSDEKNQIKLLLIGAWLRLVLDEAARIILEEEGDQVGWKLYLVAKQNLKDKITKKLKTSTYTNPYIGEFLNPKWKNVFDILSKYAHASVYPDKLTIMQISILVWAILSEYFWRQ